MVKFFQSWCGHCMRMKPDWDKLAEESPCVVIADVECGAEQDVSEKISNCVHGSVFIRSMYSTYKF